MNAFLKQIKRKINGVIWTLLSTGAVLLLLAILIAWTEFMVRLVIGLFVLIIAYVFFYLGYKLWLLKKALEKHFKL